jgi:hypothetical protein
MRGTPSSSFDQGPPAIKVIESLKRLACHRKEDGASRRARPEQQSGGYSYKAEAYRMRRCIDQILQDTAGWTEQGEHTAAVDSKLAATNIAADPEPTERPKLTEQD